MQHLWRAFDALKRESTQLVYTLDNMEVFPVSSKDRGERVFQNEEQRFQQHRYTRKFHEQNGEVIEIFEDHVHYDFDDWEHKFDNGFARDFIGKWQVEFDSLPNSEAPTQSCTCCGSILFSSGKVSVSDCTLLRRGVARCVLESST